MTVNSKILEAMAATGCSADQLVAVVRAAEEEAALAAERKRELARLRQQRRRAKAEEDAARHAMSRDVTHVTRDMRDTPAPFSDKERSPLHPPKEINSSPTPTPPELSGDNSAPPIAPTIAETPRSVLATVLDAEHAEAVIQHRRQMRKPLSVHAARLLVRRFALMPDPNMAADTMICRGWQGFEPEWASAAAGQPRASPDQRQTPAQQRHNGSIAAFDAFLTGDHHDRQPARDGADIELGRADYRRQKPADPGRR